MGLTDRDPLAQLSLPPGFRFYPTDEELLVQYLCRKVAGHEFSLQIIGDVDLYKFDPWVLPSKAMFGEKEWYFFSPRDRKYPNGSRPNRVAGSGYWKATGTDKIITTQGRKVGIKKALVFYVGKAPKGRKTNWIMHEYRLSDPPRKNGSSKLDDWVLCRIYNKTSSSASKQELLSSGTDEYMSSSISYRDHSTGAGCAGSPSSSSSHIDQVLESLPEIGQQFSPPRVNSLKTGQGSDDKLGLLRFGSGNLDWASILGLTAPAVPELNSIMTGGVSQQQQVQQGYGNNRHGNDFVVPSLPALRQVDSPPQTFRNLVDDEEVQSGPIFGSWPNGYNLNQNSNVFGQSQSLTSTMDPFIQYPNQSLGYGFRQ